MSNQIGIVQIIDSLEPGGAERMAVTIANELEKNDFKSFLFTTRQQGRLKDQLSKDVQYFHLNKKKAFDFKALRLAKKLIDRQKITIIHAHGSSWFFGVLLKIILPKVKLIWHDHHGNRVKNKNINWMLKMGSVFFDKVIVVNHELHQWAKQNLFCKKIFYLQNFISNDITTNATSNTILEGVEGKRIVCLANLRHPKNHLFIVEVFFKSKLWEEGWTLHFIGNTNDKDYFDKLSNKISEIDLKNYIFIYGAKDDVEAILNQSQIGLLLSTFEGFPVTVLEYGKANLGVVVSNVGFNNQIIEDNKTGIVVEVNNLTQTVEALKFMASDKQIRAEYGQKLATFVNDNYGSQKAILELTNIYKD